MDNPGYADRPDAAGPPDVLESPAAPGSAPVVDADPGRRPRTRLWVLLAAGLAVLVGAATFTVLGLLSGRHGSAAAAACADAPDKPTGVTAPVPAGEVRGGLKVVETGFTQSGPDNRLVSIGAVVENTSDLVAYRTTVTFRLYDAAHRPAQFSGSDRFLTWSVPVIMPGQKIGVAPYGVIPAEGSTVASVDVRLGEPEWWPAANDVHTFAAVTTRHLRAEPSAMGPGYGIEHYQVQPGYCYDTSALGLAALFRDGTGKLIGGDLWPHAAPGLCRSAASQQHMQFRTPPGTDTKRTQTYPYCDPTPAADDPTDAPSPTG